MKLVLPYDAAFNRDKTEAFTPNLRNSDKDRSCQKEEEKKEKKMRLICLLPPIARLKLSFLPSMLSQTRSQCMRERPLDRLLLALYVQDVVQSLVFPN